MSKVVLEDVPGPVLIEGGLPPGSGSRNTSLGNGKLTLEDSQLRLTAEFPGNCKYCTLPWGDGMGISFSLGPV